MDPLELLPRPVRPSEFFAPCPVDLSEVEKFSQVSFGDVAADAERDALFTRSRPLVVRQVQVMPPTPDFRAESRGHGPSATGGLGPVVHDPLEVFVEVDIPAEELRRGRLHLHDLRHSAGSTADDVRAEFRLGAHAIHIRIKAGTYP